MAYLNVLANARVQTKIEAVRGTAETTMTRNLELLQSGFSWTYDQSRSDEPEMLGSFSVDRDTVLLERSCTFSFEARLAFEMVPWWMSLALKGGTVVRTGTTTASTPPGYTYTITPDDTVDNLDTFTMKAGDGAVAYQFRRCVITSTTIRASFGPGGEATWRIAVEGRAIFVGTTTFDSPAAIARTMIRSKAGNLVFLDTASVIGTSQLTGKARSFSLTIDNAIEDKYFAETGLDAGADFGRGAQRITGEVVLEALNDTEFAIMRANTATKLRFQNTGDVIGATPAANYLQQLDVPQAKLNAPAMGYAGNNRIYTFPFIGEKPLAAQAITSKTVTAAATVTA